MAVSDSNSVDTIGVDKVTGEVVLAIADPLPWADVKRHLLVLQEKFNSYLQFVESGELVEAYPDAARRPIRFDITFREHPPPASADFLDRATEAAAEAKVKLRWTVQAHLH